MNRNHKLSVGRRAPGAHAALMTMIGGLAAGALLAGAGPADTGPSASARQGPAGHQFAPERGVFFVQPEASRPTTLYATGEEIMTDWETIWRPVCGPGAQQMPRPELERIARIHDAMMADAKAEDLTIVDNSDGIAGAGINIVYVLNSSVPATAVPAFAAAEAYLESLFSDPITVTVTVSFQQMASNILGGTSSSYTSASWTNSRNGLINGKDSDDTIQDWLPTGSTIPVRYNGSSGAVTNEGTVFWTRAAYKATVGNVTGNAASMTYNTNFTWDFDPSNGVSSGTFSFQDVIIHETGHALGFTSGGDFRVNDIEALDIFRFQFTDGSGDYNPDTLAEFQTKARLVDYNTPNDAHNSDIISAEYRMSDGSPYQMSHFREQSPNIGLMDPALTYGETHYPNFFSAADLTMFDAVGYDR